ncbi:MAG: hypothetical protein ACPGVG_07710 [Mycobacterium sp.]
MGIDSQRRTGAQRAGIFTLALGREVILTVGECEANFTFALEREDTFTFGQG